MKRKNPLSENATKGDLLSLKGELKGEMQELKEEIVEMREDHKQYKDEVLAKLDDISGQLEDLREDKLLSVHQASRLGERVDNHEKRIKSIEKLQHT